MRPLLRAALPLLLLVSATAAAVEIEAGGRTIEIPIPSGYSELTPKMSPMYETMNAYVIPTNERYLILVPTEAAEALLRGEDAEFDRYMMVEAERQSVRVDVTQAQFDEFREVMRSQLDEMYETMRQRLPGIFDDAGRSMGETLDADIDLSVGEVVPFEPHLDNPDAFAFSQLISIGVALDGEDLGSEIGMATAAIVNVRRKMIFVYVYGSGDDLEWTRVFASNWVDQILAANLDENTEQATQAAAIDATTDDVAPAPEADGDEAGISLSLIVAIVIGVLGLIFLVRLARGRGAG